jgi:hypothetical protein
MCYVVIHDYVLAHQIVYVLTHDDFWSTDDRPLLFLHQEIVETLCEMDENIHADTEYPLNKRLARLLCAVVRSLSGEHSTLNLLRLHRINAANVVYDYSASMSL